jgi:xanthine dehydrogenase small subunit
VGEQAARAAGAGPPAGGCAAAASTRADGTLHIGAAATLEDAWAALALRHPELAEMWLRFASPPVRHAGTLGGNVANGSPIGDGAPVLMALDASLRAAPRRSRAPDALDDFYPTT